MRKNVLLFIVLASSLFSIEAAFAAVNCQQSNLYPPQALSPNISVGAAYAGNDLPIGSTIYRNTINFTGYLGINCDAPFSVPAYLYVSNEPLGPPTNMSGLAYGNGTGPVYPTNVSGVGVALWSNGTVLSSSVHDLKPLVKNTAGDAGLGFPMDISLIKTGPIASGSVVNASSFPNISYRAPATTGYTGLPIRMLTVTFTGSVNFTTQTCTTPDVTVNMGTYDVSKYFKSVGSNTPWIDSSIVLQNCPVFSGYYGDFGTAQSTVGSSTAAGTTRNTNTFTVSLVPRNPVVNDVIALDGGDAAATGVGIQLGYSTDFNANPTTPQNIWSSGTRWTIQTPTDGRGMVKIPLSARYYQTSSEVTAGKANSKVEFQIDYK